MEKILVAMSGGVDSSVSAYLLKLQGFEVIGVTFEMFHYYETNNFNPSINDARIVAEKLGIKHFVVDIKEEFEQKIINYFVNTYIAGKTPNPCTLCNRIIKWKNLLEFANKLGIEKVATGHYAQIKTLNSRYYISKNPDNQKDQSYFLWNLTQEQLKRTIFPLGTMTKEQIKKIAKDIGLDNVAHKNESFDVCFIKGDDYRIFLKNYFKKNNIQLPHGTIETEDGKIVGHHDGLINFTIGQRKGLGVAMGEPYFVKELDPEKNKVIIAPRQKTLKDHLFFTNTNFQKYDKIDENKTYIAKIRYKQTGFQAKVIHKEQNLYQAIFSEPVFAITPGQSIVIYENDDIVGGGVIL